MEQVKGISQETLEIVEVNEEIEGSGGIFTDTVPSGTDTVPAAEIVDGEVTSKMVNITPMINQTQEELKTEIMIRKSSTVSKSSIKKKHKARIAKESRRRNRKKG